MVIDWLESQDFLEVSNSALSGDNIPRLCIGLDVKEDQAPTSKSEADTGRGTSPPISEGVSEDAGSFHRKAVRTYPSNLSSSTAQPQPATSQTSSTQGLVLQYTYKHLPSGRRRLAMVDSTPRQREWVNNPDDDPRVGDRDGCIQHR